jgi:hypothetical protein
MNLKTKFAAIATALLVISTTRADDSAFRKRFEFRFNENKFKASECNIDIFGTWRVASSDSMSNGRIGFGGGVSYFFQRYLGVGADAFFESVDWPKADLSIIARYPMEEIHTAPYLFGGGGRDFDDSQWTGHIGGGLEYRLNSEAGVFVDVRETFVEQDRDYMLFRVGMRLGF